MKSKLYFLILLATMLSACAHKPIEPTYRHVLPAVRQTQLTTLSHWQLSGSFSLRSAQQSVVANYEWLQQATQYDLHIRSPLNLFSIKIIGAPGRVSLWRSNKDLAEASNPEDLMQQQLGWQLPLSKLSFWVRGLPAPGVYSAQYDAWGHLLVLEQEGWVIHYSRYRTYGMNDLPGMLNLEDGTWTAKILIKRWGF